VQSDQNVTRVEDVAEKRTPDRYLLRLVPPLTRSEERPLDADLREQGWELVSDRVGDDGFELVMFRRKDNTRRPA
jgi:hypothetical protein